MSTDSRASMVRSAASLIRSGPTALDNDVDAAISAHASDLHLFTEDLPNWASGSSQ